MMMIAKRYTASVSPRRNIRPTRTAHSAHRTAKFAAPSQTFGTRAEPRTAGDLATSKPVGHVSSTVAPAMRSAHACLVWQVPPRCTPNGSHDARARASMLHERRNACVRACMHFHTLEISAMRYVDCSSTAASDCSSGFRTFLLSVLPDYLSHRAMTSWLSLGRWRASTVSFVSSESPPKSLSSHCQDVTRYADAELVVHQRVADSPAVVCAPDGKTDGADRDLLTSTKTQRALSRTKLKRGWGKLASEQGDARSPDSCFRDVARTPDLRCTDESITSLLTPSLCTSEADTSVAGGHDSSPTDRTEQTEDIRGLLERYLQAEERYGYTWTLPTNECFRWWSAARCNGRLANAEVDSGERRAAFTRIAWQLRLRQVEAIYRLAPCMDTALAAVMFFDRGMVRFVQIYTDAELYGDNDAPGMRLLRVGMPLVALTSLWIATKIHEREAGNVQAWLREWPVDEHMGSPGVLGADAEASISMPLIKAVELVLLEALGWDLVPVSPLHFAMTFAVLGSQRCTGVWALTSKLCSLSMLEQSIAGRYPPSAIGLSCLLSALRLRRHPMAVQRNDARYPSGNLVAEWARGVLEFTTPNVDLFSSMVQELEAMLHEVVYPIPSAGFSRSLSPCSLENGKRDLRRRKRRAGQDLERKCRRLAKDQSSPLTSFHAQDTCLFQPHGAEQESPELYSSSMETVSEAASPRNVTRMSPDAGRPCAPRGHASAYQVAMQRAILAESGCCLETCTQQAPSSRRLRLH
ncbi:hypothetical protein CYME_CMM069C [Cyanidioschyzon merolae strain 10D]|uniref:Uncharacterized protein n=1 Tax=Cyanidioschyzon merolae (strain NIES-3377 / 10D) TaxID=280699 RepID=M1VDQ2_CYAM1|nr:hypothetical protein CYME_CMM069C [Cyanidioschyzon merolae strain 10D]BAM80952.1 hypothetical protein CYME_CMM069C [Cyanidioschyzon merolae strain 10D]|eukprot:XP_005536988.1 hypothetical protein CYME_CMM069C [Cyanidioschyzon merolae strain 10D]